ncbi:MAG TPA: hypothetical protein PLI09_16145 [Candidatus Hydrogenedentes bacterium]|nr:hypothetical protein [Candidatus Hydrogenedentota bacterium]
MSNETLNEMTTLMDELSHDELLILMKQLEERINSIVESEKGHYSLLDLSGTVEYPAAGEDAQEWISSSRREADAHRQNRGNTSSDHS